MFRIIVQLKMIRKLALIFFSKIKHKLIKYESKKSVSHDFTRFLSPKKCVMTKKNQKMNLMFVTQAFC